MKLTGSSRTSLSTFTRALGAGVGLTALVALAGCKSHTEKPGVSSESASLPAASSFVDEPGKGDPQQLLLALKFVAFVGDDGAPVVTKDQAKQVVHRMNELYAQCNVRFRGEKFETVNPKDYGLNFHTSSMSELDGIRRPFDEDSRLVIIATGKWDHNGMGVANAWTMMPGQSPAGAVLEADVAQDAEIVAHEIGHYLNLDHENDRSNMMNPVIYRTSTTLRSDQCLRIREAATGARKAALRG